MSQATLRTERLLLVPLSDDHLELELELDADPEVMRFLGPVRSPTEVTAAHRRRLAAATAGTGYWAGLLDGDAVGWWLLAPPDRPDQGPADGAVELGYRLARRYWRRGLATDGARELLRHAFEDLGLHRVFAETMAVNAPSRATMARLGLRHVRSFVLPFDEPLPGAEHGEVEYAITRAQWLAR